MEALLSLLLELQRLQLQLTNVQSARTARTEIVRARPAAIKPVVAAVPVATTPATQVVAQPQPTLSNAEVRAQIEAYVLEETNAVRAQNGLPALTTDSAAASVARAHSADMLARNYFSHDSLSGCSSACRLNNAGYAWKSYGENIHWMSGYKLSARESAKKIVSDWMNSAPHRANILGSFSYAGVGIAVDGTKVYSTTVYTTK